MKFEDIREGDLLNSPVGFHLCVMDVDKENQKVLVILTDEEFWVSYSELHGYTWDGVVLPDSGVDLYFHDTNIGFTFPCLYYSDMGFMVELFERLRPYVKKGSMGLSKLSIPSLDYKGSLEAASV